MLTVDERAELSEFMEERMSRLSKTEVESLTWLRCDAEVDPLEYVYMDIRDTLGASWESNGMTKTVFGFEEYPDLVFKIPYRGIACDIDQTYEDDIDQVNWRKCSFSCGQGDVAMGTLAAQWDYLSYEEYLFRKAQKEGIDFAFTPVYYIGTHNGLRTYVQPYILPDLCDVDGDSYDKSLGNYLVDHNGDISEDILLKFYANYGHEDTMKCLEFLDSNHVDDLHDLNFGMAEDGSPKILDYAGFRDVLIL